MTDKKIDRTEAPSVEQELPTERVQQVAELERESVEAILTAEQEAEKRGISTQQWLDLLHVAEAINKPKEWIDETFIFPGVGKIETKGNLDLRSCIELNNLPEKLSVGGSLDLGGCTGLTRLPEKLSVGGSLSLYNCTGLTKLPEKLSVGGSLDLRVCTGLIRIPEGVSVGGILFLSNHLNDQVKKDAERLKKRRKNQRGNNI
jgi:hypothetical protein